MLKEFVIIKEKKRFSLSGGRMKYRLCMNNISGADGAPSKNSQRLKLLTILAMRSILGVLLVPALIVMKLHITVLIEKFQFG